MSKATMKEILGDFGPAVDLKNGVGPTSGGRAVTIWLPEGWKARYDSLQNKSGRLMSKKAREALLMLIEEAEAILA